MAGGQHPVERVEMILLFGVHLLQLADDALLAMLALEHGQLPAIDGDGAILAGMVHAQHLVPAFAAKRHGCTGSFAVSACIGGWLAE